MKKSKKEWAMELLKIQGSIFTISVVASVAIHQIWFASIAKEGAGQGVAVLALVGGVFWNLVFTLASISMYANVDDKVRANRNLSLALFVGPAIMCAICFFIATGGGEDTISFLISNGIFIATSVYYFYKKFNQPSPLG